MRRKENTHPWIKRPRPNPDAPVRLFCFAHAGAGASVFARWTKDWTPDIELCPVQLPGRENRLAEPLLTDMPRLLDGLVDGLVSELDRPFGVFGHSHGALIAFEWLRELRRRGLGRPVCLFASGRRAPHLPEAPSGLHPQASDKVFVEELRRLNGTPEEVLTNVEMLRCLLPIFRSDLAIGHSYAFREEELLDCPIHVFGGQDDHEVSHEELESWKQHTTGDFSLHLLPGDHFFPQTAQSKILPVIHTALTEGVTRKAEEVRSTPEDGPSRGLSEVAATDSSSRLQSLVQLLRGRATQQPDRHAFGFLTDGTTRDCLTYGQLDQQARAIAAALQGVAAPGDRALMVYPAGLEFLAAFFGCLYAGIVAVPIAPPHPNRPLDRLRAILQDAAARLVLGTSGSLARLERQLSREPELCRQVECLATDQLAHKERSDWREPDVDSDTLAFLQYTSGSTGAPKGVMVSHGNLIYNLDYIRQVARLSSDSVSVTWLPHFHDMGLIDGLLEPIYAGFPGYAMSPFTFLQRPHTWLEALSQLRATHTGAPNFAFELCAVAVTETQKEALDLGCVENIYVGAEPIWRSSLDQFASAFECTGFRGNALYCVYGMAEATLMISGGVPGDEPRFTTVDSARLARNRIVEMPAGTPKSQDVASCGRGWLETRIAIVDPKTHARCSADTVGEIWVAGPTVAQGYWRRPEENVRTFQAYLAETDGRAEPREPFLRTGDLGFMRNGELFVTGRLKDLIIIRGENHYPQDIEDTAERSHDALRRGCSAAFSVPANGEELLVIAVELDRRRRDVDWRDIERGVRAAVARKHDLAVHAVLVLKAGTVPQTSSGKTQRSVCRARFLNGELTAAGGMI